MRVSMFNRSPARVSTGACLFTAFAISSAFLLATTAAYASSEIDRLQEAWRDTIIKTPVPQEGCFTASYPATVWQPVACITAPARPFVPRDGRAPGSGRTVGDGDDYSAVVSGLISTTVGSFPTITGLKTETGEGEANSYTLQINSQFFASPTCSGAANPSACRGWEQFVYFPGSAFMQYWLINYVSECPSGWMSAGSDCYRNSKAIAAPSVVIKKLKTLKMSGNAVANGIDTLVFSTKTKAYTTTGKDSVVGLAAYWNASEWNVFGPGGGSQAVFNKGTSITVNIALTDGLTTAPTCQAGDGTTGETNNLDLGSCKATGGKVPSVQFKERLPK
jgi:hypothetical protein